MDNVEQAYEEALADFSDRCHTCDSRYCPPNRCMATVDRVYVVYKGYKKDAEALLLEAEGFEVRWDDRGFLPVAVTI